MTEADRIKYLRIALLLVGLIFTFGIYPLTILWPAGWSWHMGQSDYLQMILGMYATLGVFLMIASRKPLAHMSLIWFTVWSSVVHGGIMAVQSFQDPMHRGHLLGDVPALLVVAAVLAAFDATRCDRTALLRVAYFLLMTHSFYLVCTALLGAYFPNGQCTPRIGQRRLNHEPYRKHDSDYGRRLGHRPRPC